MVKRTLFLVCAFWLAVSVAAEPAQSPREKYNFNPGWKVLVGDPAGADAVSFPDAAWKNVTLPHAWNEDDAFRKSIYELPTGIAWYRKHFQLPPGSDGKKVFLEFEGIRQGGEFYLNGQWIGRHENGVMAFGFDITQHVRPAPQENVLAARIDNSWTYREVATKSRFEWNDKNFYANYGGINKNVFLHLTGRLYQTLPLFSNLGTTGVYVYAQDFDIPGRSATITTESQIKNEYAEAKTFRYTAELHDPQGQVVATLDGGSYTLRPGETTIVTAHARVGGLHFWSWGYGYLYDVDTIVSVDGSPIDRVRTRTGFRKTAFDHGMLTLNDHPIQIKGYAQRTTNEWPALGLSVPPWVSDFSNGLMVAGNANLVRWMHVTPWKQDIESFDRMGLMETLPAGDAERDVTGRRWDQRLEVMRDAMIYNRSDPSIIFYESGNNAVSEDHMQQMKDLRDKWDPHGGRAIGSRNMQGSKVAEYGGEMLYINKSAGKPMWAMEYSRDEALRKDWDELTPPYHKDDPPSNRNQDSQAAENVIRWYDFWQERPGTGVRVNDGGAKIIFSDSNTHFRGAQNYRTSGAVDAVRLPKDGYFADQVMWDGWVNTERPRAYIVGHWNYALQTRKSIMVVSSADKAQLFLNGQSLGYGAQSSRFLFTFPNVLWQPGVLKAIGYDSSGKAICETEKSTAGKPVGLRLTPHTGPRGLQADGADVALVDVEVVDADGLRCPTALNMIHFSLSGPAEWRGGIAQDDNRPDNYILSQSLPVQGGVNRVIVRALPQAGAIILNAVADGFPSASVTLVSHPVIVSGGLTLEMADAGLALNLERGSTPLDTALPLLRRPVPIVGVTAGANAGKATLSYDDDESTNWANDGKAQTAWIDYDLGHLAAVNSVTLKMGGWRQRAYPIRIRVDGQIAWEGVTPRSLGYVTLSFPPRIGKSLRIELTGSVTSKDGFSSLVEVAGKKVANTRPGKTDSARGTLSIVETEIYGPIADSQ